MSAMDTPAVKAAHRKAVAWFRSENLVTNPKLVKWTPPTAAVHIGQLVAIEYLSDKFDGVERVYRHEFTKLREMNLAVNGETIIVLPGFKVTTRGIEG